MENKTAAEIESAIKEKETWKSIAKDEGKYYTVKKLDNEINELLDQLKNLTVKTDHFSDDIHHGLNASLGI